MQIFFWSLCHLHFFFFINKQGGINQKKTNINGNDGIQHSSFRLGNGFLTGGSNPAGILWLGGSALESVRLWDWRWDMKHFLEWPVMILLSLGCMLDILCALSSHQSFPRRPIACILRVSKEQTLWCCRARVQTVLKLSCEISSYHSPMIVSLSSRAVTEGYNKKVVRYMEGRFRKKGGSCPVRQSGQGRVFAGPWGWGCWLSMGSSETVERQ